MSVLNEFLLNLSHMAGIGSMVMCVFLAREITKLKRVKK